MSPESVELERARALLRESRSEEAARTLRAILERDPDNPAAIFLMGVSVLEHGKPGHAEPWLRRAAQLLPTAVVDMALADCLERLGRIEAAEAVLRACAQRHPEEAEAWSRLAGLLAARGAAKEAGRALESATQAKPAEARYWRNLAAVRLGADRPREAGEAARRAVELAPDVALAWIHLGRASGAVGDEPGAVAALSRAVALDPASADARHWLAIANARSGAWTEALAQFEQAAARRPDWVEAQLGRADTLLNLARPREAVAAFRDAARLDPRRAPAIESRALFAMQCGDEFSPGEIFEAHANWGRHHAPLALRPDRRPDGRIRIGYVSPRFQRSAMAFALLPVLAAHDRDRFAIHCYSERQSQDTMTQRLRALADGWTETQALDDEALARAIASDGIDVVVDLAGHTPGNRLTALARRPAPVAVTWLDYINTTGVPAFDAIIVDDEALKPGLATRFVERPLSAGPVRFVYEAPGYAPDPVPCPGLVGKAAVTFGCFARLAKYTESALEAWAAILTQVPGSRLILKNDSLGDAGVRDRIGGAFSRRGVAARRIELRGASDHDQMLAEIREVDIVLDTFPYNGGITTLEALWMERPVVSMRGVTLAGRQGASFLSAVGLESLVAEGPPGYVEHAVQLASVRARLELAASGLRERFVASPLGDARAFARRLEAIYESELSRVDASGAKGSR